MNHSITILARFTLKPGTKAAFRAQLKPLFDTMSAEPTFVSAIVLEDKDRPDDVVFFEIWNCTRETWLAVEATKPYRAPVEKEAASIVLERTLSWLTPVAEWSSPPEGVVRASGG